MTRFPSEVCRVIQWFAPYSLSPGCSCSPGRSTRRKLDLDTINERLRGYWLTTIEDGIARGWFRDDLGPWQFYRLTRNAIWFARATTEPHDMPHVPSQELAKSCLTILLEGAAARPRRTRRR